MATAIAVLRSAPRPPDDAARVNALRATQLLDSPPEPEFDFLVALAAQVCDAPFAFLSLVDTERVFVKAAIGFECAPLARDHSLCAWSILEPEGLALADVAADPRFAALPYVRGEPRVRMYHGAHLATDQGHRLGTLCVLDTRARSLDPRQRRQLAGLARQAMALVEARSLRSQLAVAREARDTLLGTDELTGLANRTRLIERLGHECERARRFGAPLSIVLVDLDHYKLVNELHGQAVGDQVLRNIGLQLRSHLRQLDLAGRHAGEQLCLVLPGTPPAGAREVANCLREKIAATVHRCEAQVLSVTASFGVAGFEPGKAGTMEALLTAAETALQRAKENGRNRVEG